MKNITDYISKTVAFKVEYEKLEQERAKSQDFDAIEELKKKKFSAMVAFREFDDLMTCRAILNIMYPQDRKVARFIDNLINEANAFVPQKMTDVIDSYMDTVSVVIKEVKKRESWYNEFAENRGLIRFDEFIKNGKEIMQNGNTQSRDSNIVSGSQVDPNKLNQEIVSENEEEGKGVATISKPTEEELRQAKAELQALEIQKNQKTEQQRIEEEKRMEAYEARLARQKAIEQQEMQKKMSQSIKHLQ